MRHSAFVVLFVSLFFTANFCSEIPTAAPTENNVVIEDQTSSQVPTQNGKFGILTWISKTMEHNNSLFIRLLLVFFLGLLMSLTPCIYPMIPITVGILQTQGTKSVITSFLLALSYTLGIATTFAILGLLAAFAGQAMGSLMTQPLFIIPLIGLLVYLAFSMIGLYDMYVPRFLQPRDHTVQGGSFISVFIFGALSGIIASPCLSPGLVCLLCLVTTLGSKLLGFILLFSFGVGLSVPLLIIGTFSSSLNVLPRAGMWMVEIKKLFGFLMLGMCLYFLNYIVSPVLMQWILLIFVVVLGITFLAMAWYRYNGTWRYIYGGLGIALLASGLGLTFYKKNENASGTHVWLTSYETAREKALTNNKKLFIDISAPYCSICKAIENTLFNQESVQNALMASTVPVKLDGSLAINKPILEQFQVIGFPTILLINPETQTIIKKWGPELYGTTSSEFIKQLQEADYRAIE